MRTLFVSILLILVSTVFSQNPFQSNKKTFKKQTESFTLVLCPFIINDIIVFDTSCIEIYAEQVDADCDSLLGINVYLNDEMFTFLSTGNTICDLPNGFYEIYITGVYDAGESEPSNTNEFIISDINIAPFNILAYICLTDYETAEINWSYFNTWTQWHKYYNFHDGNGVGLTNGGSLKVATKWDEEQTGNAEYIKIREFAFQPNDAGIFIPKIWTGTNPQNEVYTGDSLWLNVGDVANVELSTNNIFHVPTGILVGYELAHEPGLYPAAVDEGPANPYKGDLICNGDSWESLSVDIGLDYNFIIDVKFTTCIDSLNCGDFLGFNVKSNDSLNPSLQYDKRNTELIQDNTFFDYFEYVPNQYQIYYFVEAVYSFAVKHQSDTVNLMIIGDISQNVQEFYSLNPNPTSGKCSISSERIINSIKILNLNGALQKEYLNLSTTLVQLDVSELPKGIYLIQIESGSDLSSKKLIVK